MAIIIKCHVNIERLFKVRGTHIVKVVTSNISEMVAFLLYTTNWKWYVAHWIVLFPMTLNNL